MDLLLHELLLPRIMGFRGTAKHEQTISALETIRDTITNLPAPLLHEPCPGFWLVLRILPTLNFKPKPLVPRS